MTHSFITINRALLAVLAVGLIIGVLITLLTSGQGGISPSKLKLPEINVSTAKAFSQDYPQANVFDEERADWQGFKVNSATRPQSSEVKGFLKAGETEILFFEDDYLAKGAQSDKGTFGGVKDGKAVYTSRKGVQSINPREGIEDQVENLPIKIQ